VLKEANAFDMSLGKMQVNNPKEWADTLKQLKTPGMGTLMNKVVGS